MFGRLKRGVARSGLKKYRFEMEVLVVALSAWPKGLKDCCVQLARSDKEVCTPFAAPTEGRLGWGGIEPLPLTLTLYQGPSCWDEKVRAVRRAVAALRVSTLLVAACSKEVLQHSVYSTLGVDGWDAALFPPSSHLLIQKYSVKARCHAPGGGKVTTFAKGTVDLSRCALAPGSVGEQCSGMAPGTALTRD